MTVKLASRYLRSLGWTVVGMQGDGSNVAPRGQPTSTTSCCFLCTPSLPLPSRHQSFISPDRPTCFSQIPLALVITGCVVKGASPPWDPPGPPRLGLCKWSCWATLRCAPGPCRVARSRGGASGGDCLQQALKRKTIPCSSAGNWNSEDGEGALEPTPGVPGAVAQAPCAVERLRGDRPLKNSTRGLRSLVWLLVT